VLGIAAYFGIRALKPQKAPAPAGGGVPADFIAGAEDGKARMLHSFFGRHAIVLLFLDGGQGSRKIEDAFLSGYEKAVSGKKGVLWFNIKFGAAHVNIEEMSGLYSLKYRCPATAFPGYYKFKALPSALVIDKTGLIRLVYSGYSPTLFADIRAALPVKPK
jgi:hypothetical protein